MDSGASFHTTPSKDLLSNYISGRFGKVYLADGKSLDIVGKSDINIKTSSGSLWTLHNVRHIPALKRNLMSIGQLDDEGHYTTFGDGAWKDRIRVIKVVFQNLSALKRVKYVFNIIFLVLVI